MSPQCYPVQWFCHSNFGGAFATMMKFAGWAGVAVIGKAESPVYINIVDEKVTLEDAKGLWGLDTWKTQEEIWKRSGVRFGEEWWRLDGGYSLKSAPLSTAQGQSIVATLFGRGEGDEPLTIEMRAVEP